MDRAQLLNDQISMLKIMMDGRQASIWTAMPGVITSANAGNGTCEIQPSIQGTITDESGVTQFVDLPLLLDVPVVFPRAGGFIITFPLQVGDEVLVIIASRCIDSWWQNGGVRPQKPMEARMHDLSDGFAIPGPCSQTKLPSGGFSNSRVEIRNDERSVYLAMGEKFAMVTESTDLRTLISNLTDAINNFMTTLAALTPPSTPVLNATLQVPAAAAVLALTNVTTEIGQLLQTS